MGLQPIIGHWSVTHPHHALWQPTHQLSCPAAPPPDCAPVVVLRLGRRGAPADLLLLLPLAVVVVVLLLLLLEVLPVLRLRRCGGCWVAA